MKRWPIKPIGDFVQERTARLGSGKTTIYSVTNESGFVRSLDLFDKQVFSLDTAKYKQVGYGDLAYNPSRINVGSIAICEDSNGGAVSPMYVIVRCKSGLSPRYLLYYLKSATGLNQIRGRCEGAVRFQLKFRDLCSIPVLLPPLSEQERIVRILDEADALRKLRAEADSRTRDLIPALFYEMFGDPATNPKGWQVVSIGEICNVKGGKRLPKGAEYSPVPTPFRYIRVTNIADGDISENDLLFLLPEVQAKISNYTVSEGDVVISIAGSIGLTAAVRASLDGANLTENAAKLTPMRKGKYDPVYLSFALQTEHLQALIVGKTGQVTIGKLALFRIAQLSLPNPPLSLQREFAARVGVMREMQAKQAQSKKKLEELFQSLLHRAFAGEL